MKLQNKKTGQIGKLIINKDNIECVDLEYVPEYRNLTELNAEWEDYEEPKDFWYIDDFMIMCGSEGEFTKPDLGSFTEKDIEKLKEIGNYFGTKEEAEKAVEKLKAWKRLKDKGFRFDGFDVANPGGDNVICGQAYFKAGNYDREEIRSDLELIFGGEE